MDRGLRERVRWGNVARALGVVLVLGVVVAWPVLAPEGPAVPDTAVVPVATPAVARVAPPVVRQPERRVMRRERRAGGGGGGSRPRRREPRAQVARASRPVAPPAPRARVAPPAPVAAPAPVAPPAEGPAPPDPDPVMREFGPEGP